MTKAFALIVFVMACGGSGGTKPGEQPPDGGLQGPPVIDAPADAAPRCGDGKVDPGEVCDDGNAAGGDGCSADCTAIEDVFVCPVAGVACVVTHVCGNGILETDEQCDDHNTASGDGCDANCQLEPGWTCPVPGIRCTAASCGDGIVAGFEECDDGTPGGGPQRAGVPIADIITGMYASIAICAALAHRDAAGPKRGAGQHLDLALLDSQVALLAYQNSNYFATGEAPRRIGNLHPNIVPYQPFRTRDGDVILACGNDNLFKKFCDAAGCGELVADPRFATNGKRVENRAEITRLLQDIFKKRKTVEWVELLDGAGVPNGPINNIAQVFAEPQVKARGVRIELEHAGGATLPLVASPMRFSETQVEYRLAPPLLGQHTEEVLRGILGKSDAEIARLRAEGVI